MGKQGKVFHRLQNSMSLLRIVNYPMMPHHPTRLLYEVYLLSYGAERCGAMWCCVVSVQHQNCIKILVYQLTHALVGVAIIDDTSHVCLLMTVVTLWVGRADACHISLLKRSCWKYGDSYLFLPCHEVMCVGSRYYTPS